MTKSNISLVFLFLLTWFVCPAQSQVDEPGEINVLTDIRTPFPPGCIALKLPEEPASSSADDFITRTFDAPSIISDTLDARVRATIWRVGCPNENYSIVMVRLEHVSGNPVLIPQVFAETGVVNRPNHQAQLVSHPAVGNIGASGNFHPVIPDDGITYMLTVEPCPLDCTDDTPAEDYFWREDYNDVFTLELYWGDYSAADNAADGATFEVFAYDPDLDAPQFDQPVFNGRHSGQYRVQNHSRTGLVLQIAEFKPGDGLAEDNFAFAIFFTYTDEGEQMWVVGNTGPEEPGPVSEIELEMFAPVGGKFFTNPPDSFDSDDVDMVPVGTLTLRVADCNNLEGDFNFSEGGFGSGSLEFQRLIRIAGYDCNPWSD